MSEDIVKRLQVTVRVGKPLGRRAHFTYEGEPWIAVPAEKYRRIAVLPDRLLGHLGTIRTQLVSWLSSNPGDATRVAMILRLVAGAEQLHLDEAAAKIEALTS